MQHKRIAIFCYILIYILSYFYLAAYHHTLNLFNINVHESGKLNFAEVLFYSSHFLAHIPVHIVITLVFTGSIWLFSAQIQRVKFSSALILILLLFFLGMVVIHSVVVFGKIDTLDYVLQKKQGYNIFGEGGSWKLHLVSTISLVFFIPVYVFFFLKILNLKILWNKQGFIFIGAGILLIPVFSYICEGNFLSDLKYVFTNNRYLAHSVRELVTFPVTYFPLFFIIFYDFREINLKLNFKADKSIQWFILFSLVIFIILFMYQTVLPLKEGISNLSQKPDFMKSYHLPLLYLITSHFFEHFLDTIFFVFFSGWLLFQVNIFKTQLKRRI